MALASLEPASTVANDASQAAALATARAQRELRRRQTAPQEMIGHVDQRSAQHQTAFDGSRLIESQVPETVDAVV